MPNLHPIIRMARRPSRQLCLLAFAAVALAAWLATSSRAADNSLASRPFAPGVVTTIPPSFAPDETVSTHDIVEIRSNPNVQQNVVTYDAILRVDNADGKLRPGMTASVRIVTEKRENVLRVPNAALRFKPPTEIVVAQTGGGGWPGRPDGGAPGMGGEGRAAGEGREGAGPGAGPSWQGRPRWGPVTDSRRANLPAVQ